MNDTIIMSGTEHDRYYAFTFDDGPGRLPISIWLDALEAEGAVGTFFFTGEWMDRYPERAKEIIRRGHALAPHSYYHRRMAQIPKHVFMEELKAVELAYQEATGLPCPAYMRFPYSSYNDERLLWLDEAGYVDVEGVESFDWSGISAQAIADVLIPELKSGMIAVLHSNDIAIGSPDAIKLVSDVAKEQELVAVSVPTIMESLGRKPSYRSWKIIVDIPKELDFPSKDWYPVESQLPEMAAQIVKWGVERHVNSASTAAEWQEQLEQPLPSRGSREWFGVREFEGSYWGYARAYETGDTLIIHEHGAKEAQADTLVYMMRWAIEQAQAAGLKQIEVRHDIRRMLQMCKQLDWKAELVSERLGEL
ncbi:polysaccharide deacetylase family protein [Paenibacillus paeoniae]|uniref:polysaccharide deacetylase family protein n=1 Tax=Paenibacillus paeoniae TaxID=2292705 RepID=UPI0014040A2B|nr:polysaccharide deacetylase family protein [Paenibacillus paeoniae]